MTKREARRRVAFFAYSLVDVRLCNDERLYPEDATEEDMRRIDAEMKRLLEDLARRAGKDMDRVRMA